MSLLDTAPATARAARTALTDTQTRIFISQGTSSYRLPFLYPVTEDRATLTTRVRSMLLRCPALACRFEFDGTGFTQTHRPDLVDGVEVRDGGWVTDLEQACADPAHTPDLATGLPLTATLLRHADGDHLLVEFHHIAIDGIAAGVVEQLLFGAAEPGDVVDQVLAAYAAVAEAERTHPRIRPVTALAPVRPEDTGAPLEQRRRTVDTAGLRAAARANRAFPRVYAQALFEEALLAHCPGSGYAWVSSWRWTLDLGRTVGNFPALLPLPSPAAEPFTDRVAGLMRRTADPTIGEDDPIADAAGVVFSYEDFGYATGRFVPADTRPRFALYLRVVVGPSVTELQVDLDPRLVAGSTAEAVLDHLVDRLPDHLAECPTHPLEDR